MAALVIFLCSISTPIGCVSVQLLAERLIQDNNIPSIEKEIPLAHLINTSLLILYEFTTPLGYCSHVMT